MLEIDALEVAYGQAIALWGVSLHVSAGELVCVVGPNGAGKSTLINAIAGLNPVRAGRIAMNGRSLASLPPHRFCDEGIALVPEGRRLFTQMSVRENLELGAFRGVARRARSQGLERVFELFPVLRERAQTPAGALSGGQQQMVAIGRALMAQPRLLLLDEPSLGLAPVIVLDMFRIIREINAQGVAVLLVEQNVATALEIATRACVLEEGRIVADGTPAGILAQPHIRRAYLGMGA